MIFRGWIFDFFQRKVTSGIEQNKKKVMKNVNDVIRLFRDL